MLAVTHWNDSASNAASLHTSSKRDLRLPVAVVFQTIMATADKSGSFLIVEGWSQFLTERGMRFVCDREIADQSMCLYLEHPDSDCTFFEVEVVDCHCLAQDQWAYDVIFRRLLADIDLS